MIINILHNGQLFSAASDALLSESMYANYLLSQSSSPNNIVVQDELNQDEFSLLLEDIHNMPIEFNDPIKSLHAATVWDCINLINNIQLFLVSKCDNRTIIEALQLKLRPSRFLHILEEHVALNFEIFYLFTEFLLVHPSVIDRIITWYHVDITTKITQLQLFHHFSKKLQKFPKIGSILFKNVNFNEIPFDEVYNLVMNDELFDPQIIGNQLISFCLSEKEKIAEIQENQEKNEKIEHDRLIEEKESLLQECLAAEEAVEQAQNTLDATRERGVNHAPCLEYDIGFASHQLLLAMKEKEQAKKTLKKLREDSSNFEPLIQVNP
ncbi:hypothetical protein TRFO_08450 [Tritrichomonas foetus]|uniref:BTB domain-containing protein n=1 Tax=Tritrichomonas foetus TaxID=1144522 RepID=A0A1J4JM37_9EUKA|nr:hypothetical protein TRFO_08450 [Tritrichomonas foetus]|eukprot:OHS99487.1 hypothetical protein TRFO_08450 [Tritrichomonas foetus]